MRLRVFSSARFADHVTPPGHPERVDRAAVLQSVAADLRATGAEVVEPRRATDDELLRVHDADYLTLLRETAGRAVALDPDTFTSPETYEVARLAAGAAVGAVDARPRRPAGARALALVRPPGHHAERDRAMGFCLFNNVGRGRGARPRPRPGAGGDRRLRRPPRQRHAGELSTTIPSVLFVSSHQFPYYPGTGAAGEIGSGAGARLHGEPAAAGGRHRRGLRARLRRGRAAGPAAVRARADPGLGRLRRPRRRSAGRHAPQRGRSSCGSPRASSRVADACCDGRVVALTEGGYDLKALAGLHACASARRSAGEAAATYRRAGRRRCASAASHLRGRRARVCATYWRL